MHNAGYKSALARRACRYSDARPPRKTDGVLLESEIPPRMRGKVSFPSYGIAFDRDHPRVCGEKRAVPLATPVRVGSPPRMRGKAAYTRNSGRTAGITPAYAGKRLWCRGHSAPGQDYPRICGEKFRAYAMIWQEWGSPPHMRGKAAKVLGAAASTGITPAYAGKSSVHSQFRTNRRDYPRVCGEKIVVSRTWCSRSGLPPHMRGKASAGGRAFLLYRITPAYAGKRRRWVRWRWT